MTIGASVTNRTNQMNLDWYQAFNHIEAILWVGVAVFLVARIKPASPRQRWALWAAAATFGVFGLSDWLEAGRQGRVPLWLYSMKVACGVSIFLCRFTWLGWRRWHWLHREFLFGLFCLVAVSFAIWFQYGRD
jgi:hypothetical protein